MSHRIQEGAVTVTDIYNAFAEHLTKLDELWPDSEKWGPPKVCIVELLDGIKFRLIQKAEDNATREVTAFERAARKITGYDPTRVLKKDEEKPLEIGASSSEKRQDLKDRIAKNTRL